MVTIFSLVKDELLSILELHLVSTGVSRSVRTSRGYDTASTPYNIVSTGSYGQKLADQGHEVDMIIATIAKFTDATGEELAEIALDNVAQVLIDLFGLDGEFQVHRGHWQAVDRYKRDWRPFSPIGPGYRYSESYLRFLV